MIVFSERFSCERDPSCWILYDTTDGVSKKTKETVQSTRQTYHANLGQVCRSIIDRSAAEAEDMKELRGLIETVAAKLEEAIAKATAETLGGVVEKPKKRSGKLGGDR